MNTIWIASLSMPHFEFTAPGDTKENAVAALRRCWDAHAEQCRKDGSDVPSFDEGLDRDFNISIAERILNQGYRDDVPLPAPNQAA